MAMYSVDDYKKGMRNLALAWEHRFDYLIFKAADEDLFQLAEDDEGHHNEEEK
jgi:hypothetical protein